MPKIFRLRWLPFVLAFLQGAWFIWYFMVEKDAAGWPVRVLLMDDAMISMNYARSLVQGCGLVWYCGAEKVEGFTNPLWVLYMAFWHLFHIPENIISLPIAMTGFFTLYFQLYYAAKIAKAYFSEKVAHLTQLALSLFPPSVLWHFLGLETGAVAALITFLAYRTLKIDKPDLSTLFLISIGVFLRMDFIVAATALGLFWSIRTKRVLPLVRVVGSGILSLVLLTWARWIYYGELVPNTYVLKVASIPMGLRLANGFLALAGNMGMNLPLWGLAAYAVYRARFSNQVIPLALLLIGAISLYSIYVGGDTWESSALSNRYLVMGFPFLIILAAVRLAESKAVWQVAGVAAIAFGIGNRWGILSTFHHEVQPLSSRTTGSIFSIFPPLPMQELKLPVGSTVWLCTAGTTPYFYPGYRYRDFYGKCDTAVARHSPVCYRAQRPYLLYFPGHTRLGFDQILSDITTKAFLCIYEPQESKKKLLYSLPCEEQAYFLSFMRKYILIFPYGWIRKSN